VVLVIAGLALGFVSANLLPSERRALQDDAQRVALLMQLARDEAIVRNRPIAFEADSSHYWFLIREDSGWQDMNDDDMLHERDFKRAPVAMTMTPTVSAGEGPLRVVFGREPVDKPFVLTMSLGKTSVALRADGIGHFTVE
jgi:general secretion pathway protein H